MIERSIMGVLPDGREVGRFTLTNKSGMTAKIIDFGAIITELHVPDRDGVFADVVLGFERLEPYLGVHPYFGALVGRYGNRIAGGRFTLDGKQHQLATNDGPNHLHGGPNGFDRQLWHAAADGDRLVLRLSSPDGDQGYPGNLEAEVVYRLTDANELVMQCGATADQATPVNLTQHSYFNLGAAPDVLDHELTIFADAFTPIGKGSIPTGEIAAVAGTPFDFRTPRRIGSRIDASDEQLRNGGGYDHNFVLNGGPVAARLFHAPSGRMLELVTDQPGVQFYSGNFLDGSLAGKGRAFQYRGGLCLEPQHFPDSPNHPAFPNTILRPGETYSTESRFRFSVQ